MLKMPVKYYAIFSATPFLSPKYHIENICQLWLHLVKHKINFWVYNLSRIVKCLRFLPFLQANKLACYGFKRHETPRTEMKYFITHGNQRTMSWHGSCLGQYCTCSGYVSQIKNSRLGKTNLLKRFK